MIDFLTGLVLVCAAVTATACAVAKLKVESVKWRVGDRPPIHIAAFLFFAAIATLSAQKTNSPPLRGASVEVRNFSHLIENGQIQNSTLSTLHSQLSMADVARGFLLESVITNNTYSYAMPTNGVRYDKWWKRGAYEDVFRLDLGGMRFPLKNEDLDSLWVYSWGMAGAHLMAISNRLVATGVPMSAVSGLSQFWSADAAGGARLLTWENFFLDRDTNTPVSAQLELRRSGDFVARSNDVCRLYRRVNPDDWDDDGMPNDEDPEPLIAGEPAFGPHQELPEGANSNAYFWVDVVVERSNAYVSFSGEGDSNLPDPSFVARAGDTNRVLLLIGKEYQASSRMPISCIARSGAAIEVLQDSPTSLSVLWPVVIEESQMRDGASFSMSVTPGFLGGGFAWTNSCCTISSSGGTTFTYSCNGSCYCTGCCAFGVYAYEGFSIPVSGGSCGCSPGEGIDVNFTNIPPESASVGVSFSQTALFYEEAYTNEPGVVVGRRASTNTTLTCTVRGGGYGGVFGLSLAGFDKLDFVGGDTLPAGTVEVAPGETRTWEAVYAPLEHSASENDISAVATFSEYLSGDVKTNVAHLTVIKIEITPEEEKTGCEHRHVVGVREIVRCKARPDVGQWTESGAGEFIDNRGDVQYKCPLLALDCGIGYLFNGASYPVFLTVVEPVAVVARSPRALTYYISEGSSGGVGMALSIYVLPETVSFSGIKIEEVPSDIGTHSGFFSNLYFNDIWCHTVDQGAGDWFAVIGNLKAYEDCPRLEASIPRETPDGTMTWDTQYGWGTGDITWHIDWGWGDDTSEPGDDPVKTMAHSAAYDQHFVMTQDGMLTISKLQNAVSRSTNDVFRLNGVVVTPSGR